MVDKSTSTGVEPATGLRGAPEASATPHPGLALDADVKLLPKNRQDQGVWANEAPESEFLWNVHRYTNEYIRFADAKAATIIAYSSALIAGLLSTRVHFSFLGVHLGSWDLAGWLTVFSLLALTLSIVFSGLVVLPRLRTTHKSGTIYWQDILAHQSGAKYWKSINGASTVDLSEQVALHIYALSCVNNSKYRWVKWSVLATIIGSVLCAYPFYRATYLKGSSSTLIEGIAPILPIQVPSDSAPSK